MAKRPMYLGHVNIYVRNAEKSKEWYENLLGLHTYEYRPGWAAFMSADTDQSHEVAVMQLGDDAPLQQRRQVGLNHMAWRVESLDDLKEFYGRIKEQKQPIDHIADHGISLGIYLRDPDGTVGHLYGAKTTPHMFVISPDGKLIYEGGIDNRPTPDPADIPGATNYVRAALDESMSGKPVTVATSRPYGCSVKY